MRYPTYREFLEAKAAESERNGEARVLRALGSYFLLRSDRPAVDEFVAWFRTTTADPEARG